MIVTFHGTDVRHAVVGPLSRRLAWRVDLVAAVSRALFAPEDGRPGLAAGSAVLPCGPDLERFVPQPRAEARRSLGLDPGGHCSSSPPMVFTIEPGIYDEEVGGLRHSDTVAVTAEGIEILTDYPRDLGSLTLPA